MLVLTYPAVVAGLGCAICCCWLSWRTLHKARQRRDKSRGLQWYFGSFWNAVFKFREKNYGKSKTNYYWQCSFLTSEDRGMGEGLQTVNKPSYLQPWLVWAAFFRSSTLNGPRGSGFWHIALLMLWENQVQKCCISSMSRCWHLHFNPLPCGSRCTFLLVIAKRVFIQYL